MLNTNLNFYVLMLSRLKYPTDKYSAHRCIGNKAFFRQFLCCIVREKR